MDNNAELTQTWCRMWSEDPALAHDLMTDKCRQWSGQTPGLDVVVGPQQQEDFVIAYRAQHVNVFVPRVLVDAGDRFAYLWDVTAPDGSVRSGVDVNVMRGDKVELNWTFVADRRFPGPDPEPEATDPAVLARLCREHLADRRAHHEPILDPDRGRAAVLHAGADGVGGLELITVRGGRLAQAWSFDAVRPFAY